MLRVRDLVVRYGQAVALDGISLDLQAGEAVAVIGPNGAGKSTLVNALSGLIPSVSGSIEIDGRFAQVPEGRQMFPELSVEDNLVLGAWGRHNRDLGPVFDVLPELIPLARRRAGRLSGGEQQMVAIGRALMAEPEVLAIDELSLGLAPMIVQKLAHFLDSLRRQRDIALLLIEQNARLALAICDRAYVLDHGQIIAEGPASQIGSDPNLQRAYLGTVPAMTGPDR